VRKATEKSAAVPQSESIEASFPREPTDGLASLGEGLTAYAAPSATEPPTNAPAPPAATAQPAAPTWSDEDERGFQALLARRKTAGVRRTANSGAQQLQPGGIKPNPNTVVAVIVGLVAERGVISRRELVAAMVPVTFPHPKARPADPSWCQGYVAGAIRSGFLAVAPASGVAVVERSTTVECEHSTNSLEA